MPGRNKSFYKSSSPHIPQGFLHTSSHRNGKSRFPKKIVPPCMLAMSQTPRIPYSNTVNLIREQRPHCPPRTFRTDQPVFHGVRIHPSHHHIDEPLPPSPPPKTGTSITMLRQHRYRCRRPLRQTRSCIRRRPRDHRCPSR